jgi:hypothetical protein
MSLIISAAAAAACCYSYYITTVGVNVLKVPLNIHRLVERVGIELLKRLDPSIVILLLTTIGSNHTATFNWEGNLKWRNTSKAPKAVSLQHMKPTTTTPCLGEVTGTMTDTTYSSEEGDCALVKGICFTFPSSVPDWVDCSILLSARGPQWKAQLYSIVLSQLSQPI